MVKDINAKVESGSKALKDLIELFGDVRGISARIGVEKRVRQLDVLNKAYGNKETDKELRNYKFNNNLDGYAVNKEYGQDVVYGYIKDIEFTKGYLEDASAYGDFIELVEGLADVLDLYAEIFNHWDVYQGLLGATPKPLAEDKPEEVEEYDYEELVSDKREMPTTRRERRTRRFK